MKIPTLRNTRIAILTLAALALAACASAPPEATKPQAPGPASASEAPRGPAATGEEITAHLAGMTFTSQTGEWHFARDGGVKAFDRPKGSPVVTGQWWIKTEAGSDLLIWKTTTYRMEGDKVIADGQKEDHRVFIEPGGGVVLDRVVDDKPDGATNRLWNARAGFENEAEFEAAKARMIKGEAAGAGQASGTEGSSVGKTAGKVVAGAVGITALVALCAGSMFLLCPL